jgi:hypothetical protein
MWHSYIPRTEYLRLSNLNISKHCSLIFAAPLPPPPISQILETEILHTSQVLQYPVLCTFLFWNTWRQIDLIRSSCMNYFIKFHEILQTFVFRYGELSPSRPAIVSKARRQLFWHKVFCIFVSYLSLFSDTLKQISRRSDNHKTSFRPLC